MAILGFDKHHFGIRLNEVLFASQPIQSIEHLYGRAPELDRIEKALFAPGRHIFIYGDRGESISRFNRLVQSLAGPQSLNAWNGV